MTYYTNVITVKSFSLVFDGRTADLPGTPVIPRTLTVPLDPGGISPHSLIVRFLLPAVMERTSASTQYDFEADRTRPSFEALQSVCFSDYA